MKLTHVYVQTIMVSGLVPTVVCACVLRQSGSSERREVRQFQFTSWPDHGVPEYPTPFLNFLRRVKACNPPDAGPIIAHCRYITLTELYINLTLSTTWITLLHYNLKTP